MNNIENSNFYELLEIPVNADKKQIQEAYVRAKKVYSENSLALYGLFDEQESSRILERVEEAYIILSSPEKRMAYDTHHSLNEDNFHIDVSTNGDGEIKKRIVYHGIYDEPDSKDGERLGFVDQLLLKKGISIEKIGQKTKILKSRGNKPEFEKISTMENKIQSNEMSGEFLVEIREYMNISNDYLVAETKVSRHYLDAIENEDIQGLPAKVYLRGFLLLYAKVLGIDGKRLTQSYISRVERKGYTG